MLCHHTSKPILPISTLSRAVDVRQVADLALICGWCTLYTADVWLCCVVVPTVCSPRIQHKMWSEAVQRVKIWKLQEYASAF